MAAISQISDATANFHMAAISQDSKFLTAEQIFIWRPYLRLAASRVRGL